MDWLFWVSLGAVAYAYAGYWLLLRVTARPEPGHGLSGARPRVSVILAARNETAALPAKLDDLQAQSYNRELVEIIVVSDGSTDGTAERLRAYAGVHVIDLPRSGGKANAINLAVQRATGELLVFFDARQRVQPNAIERLVAPFADPGVGAVSGELVLVDAAGRPDPDALGIYWKMEKSVRRLESASGSVVGVTGAIYALRRSLFEPLPTGLILDDVWLPMHAARKGGRVLFEPRAVAQDRLFTETGREWSRKVRTLAGNYQLLARAPWLITPANPLLFRFVSHKLLRLLVPFLLVTMLVSSALAASRLLHVMCWLQLACFGLAALGALVPGWRRFRPVGIPYTFVMLNLAAAVALFRFLARHELWTDAGTGAASSTQAANTQGGSRQP